MNQPPNLAQLAQYRPRWLGVYELNLGDAWRAVWERADELPEDAPVYFGRVVVVADERGYVTRQEGSETWQMVEGYLDPGETAEAFVKRAALEQTGAIVKSTHLVGFLECKATSHNPDFEAGTVTVQPLYLAVADKVSDVPEGSPYQRRRLPINEFLRLLRASHPEIERYVAEVGQKYAVLRAQGQA
jgi:ADP-ribose pyrophosphatase YjhB (NUDIX family)